MKADLMDGDTRKPTSLNMVIEKKLMNQETLLLLFEFEFDVLSPTDIPLPIVGWFLDFEHCINPGDCRVHPFS